jgi:Na+-driven multidrug efflux pump
MTVIALALWIKASNMTMIIGILRSGGDTHFAFVADTVAVWLAGVPLAFAGAFYFRLPIYWVVLLVVAGDELLRFSLSLWRVRSGRWINNVVQYI